MRLMNERMIERLRKEYPAGCTIELDRMDDPQAPPEGTRGRVRGVDDAGQIMVAWETGSSLSAIYGVDEFRKID